MAIGMTFVIYIGGIDLSAQSIASMSTVVLVILLSQIGALAIPLTLLVGAVRRDLRLGAYPLQNIVIHYHARRRGIAMPPGRVISGQRAFYILAIFAARRLAG